MAKLKLILIVVLFVGVVGYLIYSGLQETTVYYHTVDEVLAGQAHDGGRGVRVTGTVVPGSVRRAADELAMDFQIADQVGRPALTVHYQGVIPDNFKEGMAVVVEGDLKPGRREFDAATILLKCPSKYEKAPEQS
ncbi:MAG TPA: cytochrome c maturation protein CcmE [Acidobacteriota bacterium]|nr:cytochrome c maturation protein CcmE [Acidobacteriota bacterium]HOT00647.1 cytochrome c maturation protein CcmE [Acidobacteriota bacterium]HQF85700.1 cytochrome c maturation protein CcmE [Acidobacteriota bacterium]HQG91056.1 cytochrome c maturation protein CcmE [Acidobacteriota bacterium]HQK86120.1 cytochrome c maturation protein CcmE [Acidobacteriota bacterium]